MAKKSKKASKKAAKAPREKTISEASLTVLKKLKSMRAVNASSAVSADRVIEALKGSDFDAGHQLYAMRHAETPLTARAEVEGVVKATYLTKAGLVAIGG